MNEKRSLSDLCGWLDLPVADLERACAFYRAVLARAVEVEDHGDETVGVIEHGPGNGACLVPGTPSRDGVLVYLDVDGRLHEALTLVREHGGEVLRDAHPLGPYGYRALIADSEGNRIALHSMSDA